MISTWLLKCKKSVEVELVFPVRGHSFLPPDRLFGNIERALKKLEVIDNPQGYIDIIERFTTVRKLGEDVQVYGWMAESQSIVKPTGQWHFRLQRVKRCYFKKSVKDKKNVLVRGEEFYLYHPSDTYKKLVRVKRNLAEVNPSVINRKEHGVNPNKIADVATLLSTHYGKDWNEMEKHQYYHDVITHEINRGQFQVVQEDTECEPREEAPELAV